MMEIFSASLLPFPMVQARRPDSLPNICHPSSTMGTPSPACFLASLHSRLVTISFRIKFFAHHHPLTLIESYSYKRKGKRVGSQHLSLLYLAEKYPTQSSARNLNIFKRLLHGSLDTPELGTDHGTRIYPFPRFAS